MRSRRVDLAETTARYSPMTFALVFAVLPCAFLGLAVLNAQDKPSTADPRALLDKYCVTCHNQKLRTAGLAFDTLNAAKPAADPEVWERVISKLRAGSMPPPGMPRPDAAACYAVATLLENEIDRAWALRPNPGRADAVHRLNRAEYNNAIRDLFALDVDVKPLLPGDETADGSFDNFAESLSISTAHLERYMSVARQVTRLATGLPPSRPKIETFQVPLHALQDDRQSEDLPWGLAAASRFPTISRSMASTSSRSVCKGNIRTTSKAWDGRSALTSALMASC